MALFRTLALLFSFAGTLLVHAQVSVLEGVVIDASTGLPILGVHVRTASASAGTVTGRNGYFSIGIGSSGTDSIRFSHISYEALVVPIPAGKDAGQVQHTYKLQPGSYSIPEVVVRRYPAEIVYKHASLNVGSYVVNDDGIWVLVYDRPQLWHPESEAGMRELKRARIHLLDTLFQERASVASSEHLRTMHVDHHGRPVLEGVSQAWMPVRQHGAIVLEPLSLASLQKAVLPWTDTLPGWLLGNDRRSDYPAFNHFAFDPASQTTLPICSVVDEGTLQLFRSQYKYMDGRNKVIAMNMERKLGVDREIIAGYMTGFHHDPYFHVPYAPLWVVNDTLCVFDHERGVIRRSTLKNDAVKEVAVDYHTDRRWTSLLLFDRAREEVHVVYRKGPQLQLRRLNVRTGALSVPYTVHHQYPAELQVHDGYVYYTYRPEGAWEQRTLYREALP